MAFSLFHRVRVQRQRWLNVDEGRQGGFRGAVDDAVRVCLLLVSVWCPKQKSVVIVDVVITNVTVCFLLYSMRSSYCIFVLFEL